MDFKNAELVISSLKTKTLEYGVSQYYRPNMMYPWAFLDVECLSAEKLLGARQALAIFPVTIPEKPQAAVCV